MADLASLGVKFDEDGFLEDPEVWTEEIALAIAATEDVPEMTEEHWKLVNYLRNYFQTYGVAPMIRKLVKDTGCDLQRIYELFPSGPAKGACKIAGLPKPTGCV